MGKKEFDAVAERMNEIGFTHEMAAADPEAFSDFLSGRAVMVVAEHPEGDELHMVQRDLIPELCDLGVKWRQANS